MDGGVNAHGRLVRILAGNALVHLEQVAVALFNGVTAQTLDGVAEVQINGQTGFSHAAAFVAHHLGVARGHIARNQVAEAGIAPFQEIIALALGHLAGRASLSPALSGTQTRPSLRSDSLIRVSFD